MGGSPLVAFKLYVDTLVETGFFRLIYSGQSSTYTVNTITDNLTTGVTYRFVLVASNMFGDSEMSEEIRIAIGSLPLAPDAPVKVESASSLTSITVQWN